MTQRVENKILKVAALMGGNGGEKLCATINIPVCSSTLIRALHKQPMPEQTTPRVLGLDDWAYKKRHRYGTALVDLEQRRIIDHLPDRETVTVEKWLKAYPRIEIVSRDRFINFASSVSNALPNAVQVADRWHLFKNLGDTVQRILAKAQSRIKKQPNSSYPEPLTSKPETSGSSRSAAAYLNKLQSQMNEVKDLHRQGMSIREIAHVLKRHRATVKRYLTFENPVPKSSNILPTSNILQFEDYILKQILKSPFIKSIELYQAIKAQGFNGEKVFAMTIFAGTAYLFKQSK